MEKDSVKFFNAENLQKLLAEKKTISAREWSRFKPSFLYDRFIEFLPPDLKFKWDQDNIRVVPQLLAYFSRHPDFFDFKSSVSWSKPDFGKGIYLYGPPGTGKSTLMRAFKWALLHYPSKNDDPRFMEYSYNKVALDVSISGQTVIKQYGSSIANGIDKNRPKNYWFDEFNRKEGLRHYGVPVNMEEIFEFRYELLQKQGVLTHITTNVHPAQLTEILPQRVMSRFCEMFNFIPLGTGDNYTDYRMAPSS